MRRNVVDRRDGATVVCVEQVPRAGEPGGQLTHPVAGFMACRALDVREPERPDRVTEAVVPLGEGRWELAGAPAVYAEVPRLGDQLDPGEHRVDSQRHQERVVGVVPVVAAASERHRQVEAEPVDMAVLNPVPQRVQHHPGDHRVAQVEGVAAPRHVDVPSALVQPVVGAVVQAAPGQRRAVPGLFAGVVVDDVEDDLDVGLVHRLHHGLELIELALGVLGRGIRPMGCEESQSVVSPVVHQPSTHQLGFVAERMDGE